MLNREQILELIRQRQLVSDYIDLDTQVTPNGFDLTVAQVHAFEGGGALDFSNKERRLPATRQLAAEKRDAGDACGWWTLPAGAYKIVTNETVRLPKDLIGIAFARSSLLRMGAFTQTGVWDAGFQGKSEFILLISNPQGMRLKQNARVVQLLFTHITETEQGYNGIYQEKK
ncbi:MAG TPA: deoxyuridine 5'-triphosphate nucleotidohydrolase [Candidatus Omnitrophota bacterium]|nr:deoxyuridine 5'-triphosphate nucleotidohydrolase [Candidatus Omnitrophota bacterium]HRZ14625.1 deoxyuridine 5'-triphosphate nucleotidohydrolase [Candidatus Omnitrophota bacterium]